MTEDPWDRDEVNTFGRPPSAADLLDRHARHIGAKPVQDAAAQFQLTMLRNFIDVLEAALRDEHVDPDVGRRVIERVIYGGCPNPAEVDLRVRMTADMTERLAKMPAPLLVVNNCTVCGSSAHFAEHHRRQS